MKKEHPMTQSVLEVLDTLSSDEVARVLREYAKTRMLPIVVYSLGDIRDIAASEGASDVGAIIPLVVASGTWRDEMAYQATKTCEKHLRAAVQLAIDNYKNIK
jgi:hypothetical protein